MVSCPHCQTVSTQADSCASCGHTIGAGALERGTRLAGGRVIVGSLLGRNASGYTYLSADAASNRWLIIKEFCPPGSTRLGARVEAASAGDDAFVRGQERFLLDARRFAAVQHPSLRRVLHAFEENGTSYVVLEHLEGGTLASWLSQRGCLTVAQTTSLGRQLAEGLLWLHRAGLSHLAVTPAHVFLGRSGRIALLDGLGSRAFGDGHTHLPGDPAKRPYLAPEIVSEHTPDPAADIYALGATLYEASLGSVPPDAMQRVLGHSLETSELQSGMASLISGMLNLEPQDRWELAGRVLPQLSVALDTPPTERQPTTPLPEPAKATPEPADTPALAEGESAENNPLPGTPQATEPGLLLVLTQQGRLRRVPRVPAAMDVPATRDFLSREGLKGVWRVPSRANVLILTSDGMAFRQKAMAIPELPALEEGLAGNLSLPNNSRPVAVLSLPEEETGFLVLLTRLGVIKKVPLTEFGKIRRDGLIAMELDDGDELGWAAMTSGEDSIAVGTTDGMGIRFHENDLRPLGRLARGVVAIQLRPQSEAVGLAVWDSESELIVVSSDGHAKRTRFGDFRLQNRGGQGMAAMRLADGSAKVICFATLYEQDTVCFADSTQVVALCDADVIRPLGRSAQGARPEAILAGIELTSVSILSRVSADEENETEEADEETREAAQEVDEAVHDPSNDGRVEAPQSMVAVLPPGHSQLPKEETAPDAHSVHEAIRAVVREELQSAIVALRGELAPPATHSVPDIQEIKSAIEDIKSAFRHQQRDVIQAIGAKIEVATTAQRVTVELLSDRLGDLNGLKEQVKALQSQVAHVGQDVAGLEAGLLERVTELLPKSVQADDVAETATAREMQALRDSVARIESAYGNHLDFLERTLESFNERIRLVFDGISSLGNLQSSAFEVDKRTGEVLRSLGDTNQRIFERLRVLEERMSLPSASWGVPVQTPAAAGSADAFTLTPTRESDVDGAPESVELDRAQANTDGNRYIEEYLIPGLEGEPTSGVTLTPQGEAVKVIPPALSAPATLLKQVKPRRSIFTGVAPNSTVSTTQGVEAIRRRMSDFKLGKKPWSLAEMQASDEDFEWLCTWARNLEKESVWRHLHVSVVQRARFGLLLLFLAAEVARRESTEGNLWSAVRKDRFSRGADTLLFFANGQPTQRHKEAIEAAARQFNLRHVFGVEGVLAWLNTVYLQFGFTFRGFQARLPEWLSGSQETYAIRTLHGSGPLASSSFDALWADLQRFRSGKLKETVFQERLAECPWVLPEWTEALLSAARQRREASQAEGPTDEETTLLVPARFRWDRSGFPCFVTHLGNLDDLDLEAPHYRLFLDGEAHTQILRQADGSYRTYPEDEIRIPVHASTVQASLVDAEGETVHAMSLSLWDGAEDIVAFRLPHGVAVNPWEDAMAPSTSYALLLAPDLALSVKPAELLASVDGECPQVVLLDAPWSSDIVATLEGTPFWEPIVGSGHRDEVPEWASEVDITCKDSEASLREGPTVVISHPVGVSVVYVRAFSESHTFEQTSEDETQVEALHIPPGAALRSVIKVQVGLRRGREKARVNLGVSVNVTGAAILKSDGWHLLGPNSTLTVYEARHCPIRVLPPKVTDKRRASVLDRDALMEGFVWRDRLWQGSHVVSGLAGLGGGLTVWRGPYNVERATMKLAKEVTNPGIVAELLVDEITDNLVPIRLHQSLEPDAHHRVVLWLRDGQLKEEKPVRLDDDRWGFPCEQVDELLAVAVAYQGRRLGAWWHPEWTEWLSFELSPLEAETTATVIRWLELPILSPRYRPAIQTFARKHLLSVLAAWIPDEVSDPLIDLQMSNTEWQGAVRELLFEAEVTWPEDDDAIHILVPEDIEDPVEQVTHLAVTLQRLDPTLMVRVLQAFAQATGGQPILFKAVDRVLEAIMGDDKEATLLAACAKTMNVDDNFIRAGMLKKIEGLLDQSSLDPITHNNVIFCLQMLEPFRRLVAHRLLTTLRMRCSPHSSTFRR